jgi:hypothetical protein
MLESCNVRKRFGERRPSRLALVLSCEWGVDFSVRKVSYPERSLYLYHTMNVRECKI